MQFAIAKNQQGYLTPADFNLSINNAQRSYLDYLLGEYQKYQIKRPIAVVEFGQNERIRQSISPLIYGTFLNPNISTGVAPYPSDYEYNDAMWGQYGFYNIRFIQQDRLDSYYHSNIDPVTFNPVYLINHEGFQFYPENIGTVRMSYVRTPPSIVWAFKLDGNGRPVYDPLNSQQPVWAETDILNVIARALQLVGCNLQLGIVSQYAQEIKLGGQ
jgi:hypothetical protein